MRPRLRGGVRGAVANLRAPRAGDMVLPLAALLLFARLRGLSRRGAGPAVFFATGLSNTMPAGGYSQFLSLLAKNFTVYTYDAPRALDAPTFRRVAREAGPLAYVGHSSLQIGLLHVADVRRFVLLDPSAFPIAFDARAREFVTRTCTCAAPVLTLHAEYARRGRAPFIPRGFGLDVDGCHEREFAAVGHADILDDAAAATCNRLGIRGCRPASEAAAVRNTYRRAVAEHVAAFLLPDDLARLESSPSADGPFGIV